MAHEAGKGDKQRPTNHNVFSNNYDLIFKKNQMNRRPIGLSTPYRKIDKNNYLELAKQHMTRDRFGTWSVTDAELQSFAEAVAKQVKETI